eukprot:GFUD01020688.1.p1 GENE.GFUD01020688.1~~GFUD01020688.1.p1  ORF type:complete len:257 (-),score=65.51 GFUD01020688.1:40-810(-)
MRLFYALSLDSTKLCNKEIIEEEEVQHVESGEGMEVLNSKTNNVEERGLGSIDLVVGGFTASDKFECEEQHIQQSEQTVQQIILLDEKSHFDKLDSKHEKDPTLSEVERKMIGKLISRRLSEVMRKISGKSKSQRLSLPELSINIPEQSDKEQNKKSLQASLPVLSRSVSCFISEQNFQSNDGGSKENIDDITTHIPPTFLEQNVILPLSRSSLYVTEPSKPELCPCILKLAGMLFLALTIFLLAVVNSFFGDFLC